MKKQIEIDNILILLILFSSKGKQSQKYLGIAAVLKNLLEGSVKNT